LANIKSAQKRWRQNIKRRARNRMLRSATRSYVRDARSAIEDGEVQESAEAVRQAISALDKAVSKGIIHRNNAARRKSRLMQRVNKASQATEQA
jgi:small subunit ribosomal protein S20